jgi:chromosomal replication initiator protein
MNAQQIIARVAVVFGVETRQIFGRSKIAQQVSCRQAAALIMREEFNMTFSAIGVALGYKEHSTAIYAVRMATARMERNQEYAQQIAEIRRMIKAESAERSDPRVDEFLRECGI